MRGRRGSGRDGFALVAVLAVAALLSGMLLTLSLWSRNAVENAAVADSQVEMDALLRSAVTVAAYQLFVLKLPPAQVDGQQLALDAGTATIEVGDDGGKVDLNRSDPALLEAAYRASGLSGMPPAVFAARVADWRDGNDTPSEGGAEAAAYASAGLPPPRNGDFRTVADLRWVLGMDTASVSALVPFVTVFNPAGRLNPYAAQPALLRRLGDTPDSAIAKALAILGSPRSKDGDLALQTLLAPEQALLDFEAPGIFRVSVGGTLRAGGRIGQAVVVMSPSVSPARVFSVLDWE